MRSSTRNHKKAEKTASVSEKLKFVDITYVESSVNTK